MILKEWSEAWKLYQTTRTQVRKATRFPPKARSYWAVWVVDIVCLLSWVTLIAGFGFVSIASVWSPSVRYLMCIAPLVFVYLMTVLARFVSAKAFAKQFPVEYETHGLADYSFRVRHTYVHYALFVRALRDHRYSHEAVAKLSKFADIVQPPETPAFQLSQYPSTLLLIGLFMGLFTPLVVNFITNSPLWKSDAAPFIVQNVVVIVILLVGIGILALPTWHSIVSARKYPYLEIQRFLQWAERDIEAEKPPPEEV